MEQKKKPSDQSNNNDEPPTHQGSLIVDATACPQEIAYPNKYWIVVQQLYEQQFQMYRTQTHSIEDRIVSIHQPHVRLIVRGKSNAKVEFGAKINVALVDVFSFLDDHSWDAYNEGTRLQTCVEKYKIRFGYYPKEVLVNKIYCARINRAYLKELGITFKAKPLGRPSKEALSNQASPGERNPIEGKFGQAKNAYGLDKVKARLANTSESWVAPIILVLNLVNLAELVRYNLKFICSKILIIYEEYFFRMNFANISKNNA